MHDLAELSKRNLGRLDHILAVLRCPTVQTELTNKEYYEGTARTFGVILFEFPVFHMGLASQAHNTLNSSEVRTHGTQDHFITRQQGGRMIIDAFFNQTVTDRDSLRKFIYDNKLNGVIAITRSENQRLKQYNKANPFADWQTSYSACNIVLEPRRDRRKRTA